MKQFKGLLKKDWTVVKGYVYLALLLNVLIPFGASALLGMDWLEGILTFSAAMMGLHLLVPLVLLAILLTKEMERPDVFFHSTASIHLLVGVKFLIAIGSTIASFALAALIASAALLFAPGREGISEVFTSGVNFSVSILMFAVVSAVVFYFFFTILYSIMPKLGFFAYIVTIALFFLSLDLWTRLQATAFYERLTGFWVIDLPNEGGGINFQRSSGSFHFSVESLPSLPIGEWVISLLLLVLLYATASYWFERKVRR